MGQPACKPGSVWPLEFEFQRRGGHSSGISVTGYLLQPTRTMSLETRRIRAIAGSILSLFGLAPDGVYHAVTIAGARGGLLPHLFTLTSQMRPITALFAGGLFSVALSLRLFSQNQSEGFPRRKLSGIVFPWSPDFPPLLRFHNLQERPPSQLTIFIVSINICKIKKTIQFGKLILAPLQNETVFRLLI